MTFRRTFGFIGAGFWGGEVAFPPIGKQVKIRSTAGRRGISERQKSFYIELEQKYLGLTDAISSVLVDTPLNYWGPDFFGRIMPDLAWKDFELDSIGITRPKRDFDLEWSLSYRYLPMTETYSVNFEGWKPTYGELDD